MKTCVLKKNYIIYCKIALTPLPKMIRVSTLFRNFIIFLCKKFDRSSTLSYSKESGWVVYWRGRLGLNPANKNFKFKTLNIMKKL